MAECAPLLPQLIIQWIYRVSKDGLDFIPPPPYASRLVFWSLTTELALTVLCRQHTNILANDLYANEEKTDLYVEAPGLPYTDSSTWNQLSINCGLVLSQKDNFLSQR